MDAANPQGEAASASTGSVGPARLTPKGYLRRHFFATRTAIAVTIAEALLVGLSVFEGLSTIATLHKDLREGGALEPYLWTSLVWQALVTGGIVVIIRVLSRLRTEEALWQAERTKLESTVSRRDAGLELMHRMAEEVRRCAAETRPVDCQERLQSLLGAELRAYVEARLPAGTTVALTVKCIGTSNDGVKRLKDIFRDNKQDPRHRPSGGEEPLEENYIYQSFDKAGIQNSKWVMVRDTEKMDPQHRRFRDRARERQYRSALAFPLNLPNMAGRGSTQLTPMVGFLGLDAPVPFAFDDFFHLKPGASKVEGNNGEDLQAKKEMNLFFGMADSMATIVYLNRRHDLGEVGSEAQG
jgi:hypothetical protein